MPNKVIIAWARPTGATLIIIWNGALVDIPPRFHLCDGANLTPDLRNRFVRGTFFEATLNTSGGVESVVRTHEHDFPNDDLSHFYSDDEDAHTHSFGGLTASNTPPNVGLGTGPAFPAGGSHPHSISGATTATYPHKHLEVGATTAHGPETIDLRPPWYALAYIKGPVSLPIGGIAMSDLSAGQLARLGGTPIATLTSGILDYFNLITVDTPATAPLRVLIDSEEISVFDTGDDGMTWRIVRGFGGTTATAHASGATISSPKYAVCDGTNGTPDLSEAFAIGAGGIYAVGSVHGTNTIGLEDDHGHGQGGVAATVTIHTHDVGDVALNEVTGPPIPDTGLTLSFVPGGSTPVLGHLHNFAIESDSSGHAHDYADNPGTPGASYDDPSGVSNGGKWYKLYYVQRRV